MNELHEVPAQELVNTCRYVDDDDFVGEVQAEILRRLEERDRLRIALDEIFLLPTVDALGNDGDPWGWREDARAIAAKALEDAP